MKNRESIRILAPAKINLYLELLAKRPDGYHELETLMAAVELWDEIDLAPADANGLSFEARWAAGLGAQADPAFGPLPPIEKNLAYRAIELLRAEMGVTECAQVRLTKRIPAEAGLGGASSDAAAALVAGNRFWSLGLGMQKLAELAARLGSDVPFFLHGGYALCRGRGELIEPLIETVPPLWVVILRPPFGLSTPQVYARCAVPPRPGSPAGLIAALRNRDEMALAGQLVNRLWAPALAIESRLAPLPQAFQEAGLRAHQMSGSGSSYFGVTFDRALALRAAAILRSRQLGYVALARIGTSQSEIKPA